MFGTKKLSFTLAEILIALAIIGIIAVLTIPRTMTGTQTKASVLKLKRAYSISQEVLRIASARAGYNMADITKLDNGDTSSDPYNAEDLLATAFDATVRRGTQYAYSAQGKALKYSYSGTNSEHYAFESATTNALYADDGDDDTDDDDLLLVGRNGIYYVVKRKPAASGDFTMSNGCTVIEPCILYIDINGKKEPNRIITCTTGTDNLGDFPLNDDDDLDPHGVYTEPTACMVDDNAISDIYPFYIYDGEIRPATSAVVTVLEK